MVTTDDVDKNLAWKFPILGIAEGAAAGEAQEIIAQARTRFEKLLSITLDGMAPGPLGKPEEFSHTIECPEEYDGFLQHALSIQVVDNVISNGSEPIKLQVVFEPLRPAKVDAILVIQKTSGGRWRFPLRVVATEPEVDDVIKMEAMINNTSTVSFSITNQFEAFAKFKAFFTPDSAPEFSVHPKRGVLEPLGSKEGTNFLVNFSPLEYGKPVVGFLVIQTDDMQWTYEIRGSHPRYVPPEGHHYLDNKLSGAAKKKIREFKDTTQSTNFLSRNMKLIKEGDISQMRKTAAGSAGSAGSTQPELSVRSRKGNMSNSSSNSQFLHGIGAQGGAGGGRDRITEYKNDYF